MPILQRHGLPLALLGSLLATVAADLSAQARFGMGAGPTISAYSGLTSGAHATALGQVELMAPFWLRADAYVFVGDRRTPDADGDLRHAGRSGVLGSSLSLLVRKGREQRNWYGFFGAGFHHSTYSQYYPLNHDVGLVGGIGATFRAWGKPVFVEAGGRGFGGRKYSNKVLYPMTVGYRL